MSHPAPPYHVAVDRRLEDRLRAVLYRMARFDACAAGVLFLLAICSVLTAGVVAPFIALLMVRAYLLLAFLRSDERAQVLAMYSPFEFHRTHRLCRYARLTQHSHLAHWVCCSYAGLVAAALFSGLFAIFFSVLTDRSFASLVLHFVLIGVVAFSIGSTIENLYAQGVQQNVERVLASEESRRAYALCKSRRLLDKVGVRKKGYLARRKQAMLEAAAAGAKASSSRRSVRSTAVGAGGAALPAARAGMTGRRRSPLPAK